MPGKLCAMVTVSTLLTTGSAPQCKTRAVESRPVERRRSLPCSSAVAVCALCARSLWPTGLSHTDTLSCKLRRRRYCCCWGVCGGRRFPCSLLQPTNSSRRFLLGSTSKFSAILL